MPLIRRIFRSRLVRFSAALLCVLIVLAASAWLLRITIADYALRTFTDDLEVELIDFRITELNFDTIQFRDLVIESEGADLRANSLDIHFRFSELWNEQEVDTITLSNATLELRTPSATTSESDTPFEFPQSKSELLELVNLSSFAPLPFRSIQISDSSIVVLDGQLEFPISAELNRNSPEAYSFAVDAGNPDLKFTANGTLSDPETTEIKAHLISETPLDTLEKAWPAIGSALPEDTTLKLGRTTLDLKLDSHEPLKIDLFTDSPVFEYDEFYSSLRELEIHLELETPSQIEWHASLNPEEIAYDSFRTHHTDTLRFQGKVTNLETISIASSESVSWSYDSDFIAGSTLLDLVLDLNSESSPMSGSLLQEHLSVSGYSLQPFTLTFASDLETYHLQIPDLFLESASAPLSHAAQGILVVPEDESAPISFDWKSIFNPNAIFESNETILADLLSFDLSVKVDEFVTTSRIQLDSTGEHPLFELSETIAANGALSVEATLIEDESTESYHVEAVTTFSNGFLRSKTLKATGIQATQKTRIENLPTSILETEFASLEAMLSTFLFRATASLEWQANEVSEANATAQWTGGTLSLNPHGDSHRFKAETMAGAVVYDSLRFEQLYLDTELNGDLSRLKGETTASALFEGVTLQAALSHEATNPLSELYLSGNYDIPSVTFFHSDLPGRFMPELAGSTASATLQANGEFSAGRNGFDSSLNAAITDASFSYPPSKVTAEGIALNFGLESITQLHSKSDPATLNIDTIQAGDLTASNFGASFRLIDGESLSLFETKFEILGGKAFVNPTELPLDGGDFSGKLSVDRIDLAQLSNYVDIFRGRMTGSVSGEVPFSFRDGSFALERGELKLPNGETATLSYPAKGLLTGDKEASPSEKPTFSDRVLKFLKIEPEAIAEEAMSDVTIDQFLAEFFPEDAPMTPLRIRISGTAHSPQAEIPVVIQTNVHGTMSELYNFLIRLNSI